MAVIRERISKEEFLEKVFSDHIDQFKDGKLRITRVRIPGKEMDVAHIIGTSDSAVYRNLALNIGAHEGENHDGESIGLIQLTPWESVVIAADIATKAAEVEVGFMDRFCGSLILLGERSQIEAAVKETRRVFRDDLGFTVCDISHN